MTLDTSFDLFGGSFESDPLTGIQVNSEDVGVGVDPARSTSVDISGSELVGVDLTQGVTVDVADELVGVDLAEGIASVEVAGIPVDVDLTQGTLIGVGEELLFADLIEGVAINADILAGSDILLPTALDI